MIGPQNRPPAGQGSPKPDDAALAALRAQVETLAHELEVLRHSHQQLHTYHHHLRFRVAERANLWLRRVPLVHRAARFGLVTAQAAFRIVRGRK